MKIETLAKANELSREIKTLERTIKDFDSDYGANPYDIPTEMLNRHKEEIDEWLNAELKRKKAEFEAV